MGCGDKMSTVAAVAGLPVRSIRTGTPMTSAATVTGAPACEYTVSGPSKTFSDGTLGFRGWMVTEVGVPLEGVNTVTVPWTWR
jgi:hypothetical protein